jgi:CRISPR-associated exonuclease Cas4
MGSLNLPTWPEDDLVLISALEHWSYCPRQCALIHLEQTYDENLFTLRGNRAHRRVHEEGSAVEHGVHAVRGMPLWSDRLGLRGKADVVEFVGPAGESPYPVEHKVGRAKATHGHEALQLCAQALCLEEMLGVPVPAGAISYHGSKSRREIAFDAALRARTEAAITEVRAMLRGSRLPPAVDDARCPNCSLLDACLPALAANPVRLRGYQSMLFYVPEDDD